MKGILLAGGTGSRLFPLSKTTSKQLLPVYDKPMIYYPLATLMAFDTREILVISTPEDTPNIEQLLGDGSALGLKLRYAVQPEPKGIAQAFIIGADFVGSDHVCLILGDNIFYMEESISGFRREAEKNDAQNHATIFACHVSDPERFGVVEFTDLNNLYLKKGHLDVIPMQRGNAWLDAGTPDSLMDAALFVQIAEKHQGLRIACIEELAYNRGFISKEQLQALAESYKTCPYKSYLQNLFFCHDAQ